MSQCQQDCSTVPVQLIIPGVQVTWCPGCPESRGFSDYAIDGGVCGRQGWIRVKYTGREDWGTMGSLWDFRESKLVKKKQEIKNMDSAHFLHIL